MVEQNYSEDEESTSEGGGVGKVGGWCGLIHTVQWVLKVLSESRSG